MKFISLLILLVSINLAYAQEVTHDSYVVFREPNSFDLPYLHVGGGITDNQNSLSIIYFNTPEKEITSAKLHLKLLKNYEQENLEMGIYKVISYDRQNRNTLRFNPEPYISTIINPHQENYLIDITSLVQDSNRNEGILLKSVDDNGPRKVFYSSESSFGPRLEINNEEPQPQEDNIDKNSKDKCLDGTQINECNKKGELCASDNLISINPGFETDLDQNGVPDSYILDPNSILGIDVIHSNDAYSGSKSIKLTKQWLSFDYQIDGINPIVLEQNKNYIFSAFTKGSCQDIKVFYSTEQTGPAEGSLCGSNNPCKLEPVRNNWFKLSTQFNSNSITTKSTNPFLSLLRIECADSTPFEIYIDEMHLQKVETPSLTENCQTCGNNCNEALAQEALTVQLVKRNDIRGIKDLPIPLRKVAIDQYSLNNEDISECGDGTEDCVPKTLFFSCAEEQNKKDCINQILDTADIEEKEYTKATTIKIRDNNDDELKRYKFSDNDNWSDEACNLQVEDRIDGPLFFNDKLETDLEVKFGSIIPSNTRFREYISNPESDYGLQDCENLYFCRNVIFEPFGTEITYDRDCGNENCNLLRTTVDYDNPQLGPKADLLCGFDNNWHLCEQDGTISFSNGAEFLCVNKKWIDLNQFISSLENLNPQPAAKPTAEDITVDQTYCTLETCGACVDTEKSLITEQFQEEEINSPIEIASIKWKSPNEDFDPKNTYYPNTGDEIEQIIRDSFELYNQRYLEGYYKEISPIEIILFRQPEGTNFINLVDGAYLRRTNELYLTESLLQMFRDDNNQHAIPEVIIHELTHANNYASFLEQSRKDELFNSWIRKENFPSSEDELLDVAQEAFEFVLFTEENAFRNSLDYLRSQLNLELVNEKITWNEQKLQEILNGKYVDWKGYVLKMGEIKTAFPLLDNEYFVPQEVLTALSLTLNQDSTWESSRNDKGATYLHRNFIPGSAGDFLPIITSQKEIYKDILKENTEFSEEKINEYYDLVSTSGNLLLSIQDYSKSIHFHERIHKIINEELTEEETDILYDTRNEFVEWIENEMVATPNLEHLNIYEMSFGTFHIVDSVLSSIKVDNWEELYAYMGQQKIFPSLKLDQEIYEELERRHPEAYEIYEKILEINNRMSECNGFECKSLEDSRPAPKIISEDLFRNGEIFVFPEVEIEDERIEFKAVLKAEILNDFEIYGNSDQATLPNEIIRLHPGDYIKFNAEESYYESEVVTSNRAFNWYIFPDETYLLEEFSKNPSQDGFKFFLETYEVMNPDKVIKNKKAIQRKFETTNYFPYKQVVLLEVKKEGLHTYYIQPIDVSEIHHQFCTNDTICDDQISRYISPSISTVNRLNDLSDIKKQELSNKKCSTSKDCLPWGCNLDIGKCSPPPTNYLDVDCKSPFRTENLDHSSIVNPFVKNPEFFQKVWPSVSPTNLDSKCVENNPNKIRIPICTNPILTPLTTGTLEIECPSGQECITDHKGDSKCGTILHADDTRLAQITKEIAEEHWNKINQRGFGTHYGAAWGKSVQEYEGYNLKKTSCIGYPWEVLDKYYDESDENLKNLWYDEVRPLTIKRSRSHPSNFGNPTGGLLGLTLAQTLKDYGWSIYVVTNNIIEKQYLEDIFNLQNLDDDHARESLVYVRNALSAYRTEINYVKNSANSGFFQPSVLKRDKISDVKLVELNNQLFSDATHSTYGIGGSQGGIHVWNVVDIGSNIYEVHWGDGPRDKELFEGEEAYSEAEDRNIEGYAWTYGFVTVPPEQAT